MAHWAGDTSVLTELELVISKGVFILHPSLSLCFLKEDFSTDAGIFFLCFLPRHNRISACEVLLCYYMNMDKGIPPLDIKWKK